MAVEEMFVFELNIPIKKLRWLSMSNDLVSRITLSIVLGVNIISDPKTMDD